MQLHVSRIELNVDGKPYVVWGFMIVALLFQYNISWNQDRVSKGSEQYCNKIFQENDPIRLQLLVNPRQCQNRLLDYHHLRLVTRNQEQTPQDNQFNSFYASFALNVPASVEARLAYHSQSWNPFPMLASNLGHRDWQQFFASMGLLMAFASIIELLIYNRLLFVFGLCLFSLVSGYSASFVAWVVGEQHHILGMTGIVTGMIGMATYVIPQAKLRAQIGKFFFLPVWLPVWSYTLVFLLWDWNYIATNHFLGGPEFFSHIVCLITGYLLAKMLFKDSKEDIQYELNQLLDYKRSQRQDYFGALSSYIGDTQKQIEEIRSVERKREWARFEKRLHNLINVYEDSQVMALILENHEFYVDCVEVYEDLFKEIGRWRKGKAYLCLGRLIIGILLLEKRYARAFLIAQQCLDYKNDFLLGSNEELIQFLTQAVAQQEYDLANIMLDNAQKALPDFQYREIANKINK